MFKKKTVEDIDVQGKKVLVRVDFNVPLKNGQVSDDTRIRAALPTIRYLLEHGAAVILTSHLGRPKGNPNPQYTLRPVANYLGGLLDAPVKFASDTVGPEAKRAADSLRPGEVLVVENTRFSPGEEKNDAELSKELASLGDLYVNDAFGSAHRAHASTAGVTQYLPGVAGYLLEKEIRYLGQAIADPERPFVAILGGAKISDKIGVIRNLIEKADAILIGGGMANTFFKAQGYPVGDSLVEDDALETARQLIAAGGDKLRLPSDVVITDKIEEGANVQVVQVGPIPEGWKIVDIGPLAREAFAKVVAGAQTVVWNGPMGVFEVPPFDQGTLALAEAVAKSEATSIVGGGDSVAAIQKSGLADQITHISTGGGASLEMLEGLELPGVAALQDK